MAEYGLSPLTEPEITRMDAHNSPTARYEDLAPQLRTGDLVLFHGKSRFGRMLELAGGSAFSHIGMIVRREHDARPLLWHAVPHPLTEDVLGEGPHPGAQLNDLSAALALMTSSRNGDTPFVRRLVVERTPAMDTAALQTVKAEDALPFPSIWRFTVDWIMGHLHIPTTGKRMNCAEVLARTYQQMGLLPPDPPPNAYAPRDFSARHMKLRLQGGATLGPEVMVVGIGPGSDASPGSPEIAPGAPGAPDRSAT